MFKWIRRTLAMLGLWIEKASETDAYNEATVEIAIREKKAKADKAHYANGQLKAQIILLKDQVRRQDNKKKELQTLVDIAIKQNDEANGAIYAEELANMEADFVDNSNQLTELENCYNQNTQIIAESIRYIQKAQREFETLKAKVAMSRNMEGLASLMKASVTELQGVMGGEEASAMERMRVASVQGQAQITSTMDLSKEMGSNIQRQQEARKARGKALFEEYKAKAQAQVVKTEVSQPVEQESKQKIAVAQ